MAGRLRERKERKGATECERVAGLLALRYGRNVGSVKAFFFDDETWRVRYLVAKASGLLLNREVLTAPEFVEKVDRDVQRTQ